ncbi:chemotaxis protein CheX [Granulicella sibirica]|uniref:Chemotaxis phosphatase CheX-like domain-containing protein n=1 Tax=Granulicella sibirica TaxID=2479048 RepID=A0A4Q0T9A5_9BACT|nr:chemotaxis protein CheX [Granulicella sibirica]RXH58629.1 hypothetical protein GRAN_1939 [Granulicella sibirica]
MKASDLAGLMPVCCSDVLHSMCFTSLLNTSTLDAHQAGVPPPREDYGFGLRFKGVVSGRFGMHLGMGTARTLTANFLAKEVQQLAAGDVDEIVCELANMLCGSVVSQVDGEHGYVLTPPEPIGTLPDFDEEDVLISRFDTDSGTITTWFVVEGEPCPR